MRRACQAGALQLVLGDGAAGARLVGHARVGWRCVYGIDGGGVGDQSQPWPKSAGRSYRLIAETGGINAMIVDATALPEQVTDDAVMSAFRSAGQRCSALQLLAVQEDVADKDDCHAGGCRGGTEIGRSSGPGDAYRAGDRCRRAARGWSAHIAQMTARAQDALCGARRRQGGYFVAPHIFELSTPGDLAEEVFGPVLHVVRYKAAALDGLLDALDASGYGLTLGIHTRIDARAANGLPQRLAVGNIYVNRNMIGAGCRRAAVWRVRACPAPGPKAGGPDYLRRFGVEQTISINTAAAGGNAALLSAEEVGA